MKIQKFELKNGFSFLGKMIGIENARNIVIQPVKHWTEHLYNLTYKININNLK